MANVLKCRRIYEPVSETQRAWLSPIKKLLLLYRSLRLVRAELEITAGTGSPGIPCLYLGEGLSLDYYRELYQSSNCPALASISAAGLLQEIARARHRFPVILVETNRLLARFLPQGALLTYPWVRQRTDLAGDTYRHRRRGIEGGCGRSVRRYGFQCRLSRDPADLEVFHFMYHLPHIVARHGDRAAARTLPQLKSALRSGFLLQVWQGDRWVSGLLAQRVGPECIYPLATGLHPDYFAEWQNGALAAACYFLFRWARDNGLRIVDLGGSRPHLMDGVFRHKALWAASPQPEPWHHTSIAFYLDPAAPLPAVVTRQLIWNGARFLAIGECLPEPAKVSMVAALEAAASGGVSGKAAW